MKFDYFIASRYRNKAIVLSLTASLRKKGKKVYCFIESSTSIKNVGKIEDDAEEAIKKFEAIPNWRNNKKVREIFDTDMEALKNSDNLILLLPSGKSAHIEAGVAYGMGKNCIVIGKQKETESLYLIFNQHFSSTNDFIESI